MQSPCDDPIRLRRFESLFMSDQEKDNITPFRLPEESPKENKETFGERLRRRREELSAEGSSRPLPTWQSRRRTLTALVVESPHHAASIARKRAESARSVEGVEAVILGEDLPPFQNTLGAEFSGEPLLAEDEVFYRGQPVAIVVARDELTCRRAIEELDIEYHTTEGIVDLEHSLAMNSYHGEPHVCERGKAKEEISKAPKVLRGKFLIAPQESCLSEPLVVTVRPVDGGLGFSVSARALLPTSVRTAVSRAADIPESSVFLDSVPLPGVTEALEMEPVRLAMLATHASIRTGSTVRLALASEHSPLTRGRRHAVQAGYEVGFDEKGVISALTLNLSLDAGYYVADSATVMDRAMLHADSVYAIPNLRIAARLCRTNSIVSSSLPAEGAAQGTWAIEEVIQRVADAVDQPPHTVRQANFYQEDAELKTAPYGQPVSAAAISRVWNQVLVRSDYENRLKAVGEWNRKNSTHKRGISIVPVKFGLGDPRPERNAAAAIVQILADGSVLVRIGMVDVNDGLSSQISEEVAGRLGIDTSSIRVVLNDFDVLPRATPVLGTDAAGLVLRALREACGKLQTRLREVALQLFAARGQTNIEMEAIRFSKNSVGSDISPTSPLHFKEVIEGAWKKRINLVATGYHRTPNLWWDPELGAGWPFSSFTYAAAVAEIQIDAFTGEIQVLRLDVAHEGSPSANQGDRDFAQLMRAFTMGMGWILSEEADSLERSKDHFVGEGVAGFADAPFQVVTDRLRPASADNAAGDPCGEAPLLLAVSVREALWDALRAFGLDSEIEIDLPLPATPPAVLATCKQISQQLRERNEAKKNA